MGLWTIEKFRRSLTVSGCFFNMQQRNTYGDDFAVASSVFLAGSHPVSRVDNLRVARADTSVDGDATITWAFYSHVSPPACFFVE